MLQLPIFHFLALTPYNDGNEGTHTQPSSPLLQYWKICAENGATPHTSPVVRICDALRTYCTSVMSSVMVRLSPDGASASATTTLPQPSVSLKLTTTRRLLPALSDHRHATRRQPVPDLSTEMYVHVPS